MNPFGQPSELPPLGSYNSQQMLQIAGNSQVPLAQLREMAQAQTYMQEAAMHAGQCYDGIGAILVASGDVDFWIVRRSLEEEFGYSVVREPHEIYRWV